MVGVLKTALHKAWRTFSPNFPPWSVALYFTPPGYAGSQLSPRRRLNFYFVRLQRLLGHTRLFGSPTILTLEAANACNLRCPYCFIGAGEVSRDQRFFPMPLYRRLIEELGDYLLKVEFCNWGEPLLSTDICEQIRIASTRKISTIIATNFSLPFDSARAEALVSSGLSNLGVSIDGARQKTYERYRVGGDLSTVLGNVRLVREAKKRLRSSSPRLVWSFHVFEHNQGEIDLARSMARELEMEISVEKGWVAGQEWGRESGVPFITVPTGDPCAFLWERAVVHVDGGVSPCDGTFYREDDFGSISDLRFKEVWNNETFREARNLFRPHPASAAGAELVCRECPAALTRQDYLEHLAAGGGMVTFNPRFTANDGFNHFFNRRPPQGLA